MIKNQREPYSYRHDKKVPNFPDDKPVIVFDGYCAFCSVWANFVLRHDVKAKYRLLPAQSPLGYALYEHYGLDPKDYSTNLLIDEGVAWFKAAGSIRMIAGLGFPWSMILIFKIIPLSILDVVYEFIARNRFRILGRRQSCYLPSAEYKSRFLN